MFEQVRRCYDELASQYHLLFADWNASIERQASAIGPYLERAARVPRPLRILDCACGIGTQSIGLAQRGHAVTGCDLSPATIDRARREVSDRGINARFVVADLLDLSPVPEDAFDAVVCLDNSLPHLASYDQLCQAATQMREKLRNGGVFLASIRDYDRLVQERPTVQGPDFYLDHGERRIVHQIWDWRDDLRYDFHLYITRQRSAGWQSDHYVSTYRAVLRAELTSALLGADFKEAHWMLPSESGFYQPVLISTC